MEENIREWSVLSLFARKCLRFIVCSNLGIGRVLTTSQSWIISGSALHCDMWLICGREVGSIHDKRTTGMPRGLRHGSVI